MEFDSQPVVSLLVLWVSGLTVQVAHMPLKVLASAAFGKKWPWPVQPEPAAHTLSAWQLLNGKCLPARRGERCQAAGDRDDYHPPPPTQPAHWKLIPTNKLLSTCQWGGESESNMDWQKKKKTGREMCGKVNVRSPNKQGLMTPRQVSFRCFVADVENAASPTEGNKKKNSLHHLKTKWWVSKKKQSKGESRLIVKMYIMYVR